MERFATVDVREYISESPGFGFGRGGKDPNRPHCSYDSCNRMAKFEFLFEWGNIATCGSHTAGRLEEAMTHAVKAQEA